MQMHWRSHHHHVRIDELSKPNAGIEAAFRKVDHLVARSDLDFNFAIGFAEGGDDRLQE